MTAELPRSSRFRRAIAPALVTVAIVGLGVVYRQRLIAWFSGRDAGAGGSSPVAHVTAARMSIDSSVSPDPPRPSGNHVRVELHDAAGKPIDGATVTVTRDMPAMGAMPEVRGKTVAVAEGQGVYTSALELAASGAFSLEVRVESSAGAATARYGVTVGSRGLTVLGGKRGTAAAPTTSTSAPSMPGMTMPATPAAPTDVADDDPDAITVDESRRQILGIRNGTVVRAPMTLDVRAVGRLAYDETQLKDVTIRVSGYITKLRVNATGQSVRKGDILFAFYSPELYAAQQECLFARRRAEAAGDGSSDPHADPLLQASEKKLRLWGFDEAQLKALYARGEPLEDVPFASPASGVVTEKNVVEGDAIQAGMRLFRIAALDDIWVEADVYESDLARVHKGQRATVVLTYLPGQTFEGTVAFIYPYLDPASRTGRVRVQLPNRGLDLKPDMYATVSFKLDLGARLQVPKSAVVYTGPRRIVFVDLGDGRLVPRDVTLGAETAETVEILTGLREGQQVVISGNFLVASESRIRSASFWESGHDAH